MMSEKEYQDIRQKLLPDFTNEKGELDEEAEEAYENAVVRVCEGWTLRSNFLMVRMGGRGNPPPFFNFL